MFDLHDAYQTWHDDMERDVFPPDEYDEWAAGVYDSWQDAPLLFISEARQDAIEIAFAESGSYTELEFLIATVGSVKGSVLA